MTCSALQRAESLILNEPQCWVVIGRLKASPRIRQFSRPIKSASDAINYDEEKKHNVYVRRPKSIVRPTNATLTNRKHDVAAINCKNFISMMLAYFPMPCFKLSNTNNRNSLLFGKERRSKSHRNDVVVVW